MMSKHTEGPWSYDRIWALVLGPHDQEICAVHAAVDDHDSRHIQHERAEANAALIAAAPDMKKALQSILRALSTEGGHVPDLDHARETARAAIRKAEGGQQ